MRLLRTICLALAVALLGMAEAQSVVVPNANTAAVGTGGLNTLTRDLPRTYQLGIAAAELAAIPVGSPITGLSFRAWTGATTASWPAADASWTNFDIALAQAALPLTLWSSTYADNVTSPVIVRSGPMTIPAGAFANNTSPNAFDTFYFAFQRPYVYQGGDLVIHVTHDGNDSGTAVFLDRVVSNPTAHGLAVTTIGQYDATSGVMGGSFTIPRIHFGYGDGGCADAAGRKPLLIVSGDLAPPTPPPGNVNIAVVNGIGGAYGGIIVGLTSGFNALPGGCNVLITPPIGLIPFQLSGTGAGNGRYAADIWLPAEAAGVVTAQAYILDAVATDGIVLTNAITLTITQ